MMSFRSLQGSINIFELVSNLHVAEIQTTSRLHSGIEILVVPRLVHCTISELDTGSLHDHVSMNEKNGSCHAKDCCPPGHCSGACSIYGDLQSSATSHFLYVPLNTREGHQCSQSVTLSNTVDHVVERMVSNELHYP